MKPQVEFLTVTIFLEMKDLAMTEVSSQLIKSETRSDAIFPVFFTRVKKDKELYIILTT